MNADESRKAIETKNPKIKTRLLTDEEAIDLAKYYVGEQLKG